MNPDIEVDGLVADGVSRDVVEGTEKKMDQSPSWHWTEGINEWKAYWLLVQQCGSRMEGIWHRG